MIKPIKRLLVANRSEIAIRVFRSARELGITPVAMYSYEDRYGLHRFHADEAYQIGEAGEPIKNYLNIEKIIALAKAQNIDAIHPGYGFLSENPTFAERCREEGLIFVGPKTTTLNSLGDKTSARAMAEVAEVPILGGANRSITDLADGLATALSVGYPIMLKAAHGGGGRGMRKVMSEADFEASFHASQRESFSAFGSKDIFIEKLITKARHIEVQILADQHGNLVHLHERDCSVQRRYQKVVEIAPAPNLAEDIRQSICAAACKIAASSDYENAGTVEFLLDDETQKFYFIEVNPRIQVEHTVTEEVTGIDIIRAQILVAQGHHLDGELIDIPSQESVTVNGFALQCRITTEDPTNSFMPDYGRLTQYRSASGIGIRLDAGSAFSGAIVTAFFDSMLVKISARARTFDAAITRMTRALNEFRVRGVKTNIPFLLRLLEHDTFREGLCSTTFIDTTPQLLEFKMEESRTSRILHYIANTIVNGNELVKGRPVSVRRAAVPLPNDGNFGLETPKGSRDIFKEQGVDGLQKWILNKENLLITDTTFRDAHQSLFATRMRTVDMLNVAQSYAHMAPELFSLEMWGGATFDTSMRFLKEDPWQRLNDMRERVPNILFQMLLRSSSVVGYVNYPDNVVREFIRESVDAGMDVFRIFDALNWVPNMRVAMESVQEFGGICEAAVCYSGDLLDPTRTKYTLEYYIKMARELEDAGAHILCIKDMAGLLKPDGATLLFNALKQAISIPIHYHTHDTSGMQAAAILNAAKAGLDIADAAMAPLSGGTSQPNLNTLAAALKFDKRNTGLDTDKLDVLADYWRSVREFYTPFEAETLPATADLYKHEMPGGQYTNLFEQARSLGLADRWVEVCEMYASVNQLFGDIVKVTPTSKVVGDMALFMVANDLTAADITDSDKELAFPASTLDLMSGRMGQPYGGFPESVQKRILKGEQPLTERAGESLDDIDFQQVKLDLSALGVANPTMRDALAHTLYPKVYEGLHAHLVEFDDTSHLPTPVFFYGLKHGEEITIDEEYGKALIIKFQVVGEAHEDGRRTAFFEVNGQPSEVVVTDKSLTSSVVAHKKAEASNTKHIGTNMPGIVVNIAVQTGDKVSKGQSVLTLEAMKMESTLTFETTGTVGEILVHVGSYVEAGDLLVTLE
ncbi:MAG: pyruvate carboxylase [Saprospiraceae bacterium]|jgi:pyruvate carboxylase